MSISVQQPVGANLINADSSTVITRGGINSINDLVEFTAEAIPDGPLVAYPASDGSGRLTEYTARDLDQYADQAAKELARHGLRPKSLMSTRAEVVALLGPSNLDYFIALVALSRMGFAVLFLSTRLPTEAYVSLLKAIACNNILVDAKFMAATQQIQQHHAVDTFTIPNERQYSQKNGTSRYQRSTKLVNEDQCTAFIVHSSGSTGLPKPIFQTHRACLVNYASGSGLRSFVTLPLYHNHGIATPFRGIVARKKTVLYNADLPMTAANLVSAMQGADPESFNCVPYALKVLSENPEGVEALKRCKVVLFGGSSCPDDTGDALVKAGVYLVGHYGATEMGQLLTSYRGSEDKAWNYMRPFPKVKPYLDFKPMEDGLFECVVLDGLPTKVLSNSDDPPNSFHTRDTFQPHPTIPDAWKYVGRLDDRVTLVNGEKVLPIPYEHRIRQEELVEDCLVFGIGKAFPGLFITPSARGVEMSRDELLRKLKPAIHDANNRAEKFGQIPEEMIAVLPREMDYPRTDKGTLIRAACYKRFADLIEDVYRRFETPDETHNGELLRLNDEELQKYLFTLFVDRVDVKGLALDTDFFEAGTDSRQAIAARGHIMREVYLNSTVLGQNVVFEHPTVRKLAAYLQAVSSGQVVEESDEIAAMRALAERYSDFSPLKPGTETPGGDVVVLTGATGSLGAYILAQLVKLPHITRVYCLVRASSLENASKRVSDSLTTRRLTLISPDKVVALPSDLSKPRLGLEERILGQLSRSLTTVIHSAWAVNFNLGVTSFESHHIRGTYNLLRLCQSVPFARPARFTFISSVSAAAGTPIPATVRETYVEDPNHAQNLGYARSKWVTEHVLRAAARRCGQDVRVLRSGQLVGDTVHGLWNPTEAIPLMIQSAKTIGALPALDETPSWVPMDKCAEAVIQLSGVETSFAQTLAKQPEKDGIVYHVQNTKTFSWTDDLLPALAETGLQFETLSQREWIGRLKAGEQDPTKNPTMKLLDFFTEKYDNDRPGRQGLVFDTRDAEQASQAIAEGVGIIGSGLIEKFVNEWEEVW